MKYCLRNSEKFILTPSKIRVSNVLLSSVPVKMWRLIEFWISLSSGKHRCSALVDYERYELKSSGKAVVLFRDFRTAVLLSDMNRPKIPIVEVCKNLYAEVD